MWIAATGTLLSAYFILAANAWMQHPVGYTYNARTHQDKLTSFAQVLFNPAQLAGFPHVIAGCFLTARRPSWRAIALWQVLAGRASTSSHALAFRHALKAGAITAIVGAVAMVITGDTQGKLFTTQYQPMKMAAAEALYHTSQPAPFSLLTIGSLNGSQPDLRDRHSPGAVLPRHRQLVGEGAGHRQPAGSSTRRSSAPAPTSRSSRSSTGRSALMIGVGMLAALIAIVALWVTRRGRTPAARQARARGAGRSSPGRSSCRCCRCSATRWAGS